MNDTPPTIPPVMPFPGVGKSILEQGIAKVNQAVLAAPPDAKVIVVALYDSEGKRFGVGGAVRTGDHVTLTGELQKELRKGVTASVGLIIR